MAEFLERRGHRTFQALGIHWAHYRGPFFCSLPYERRIGPEPGEIQEMMRRQNVRCVRFPSARGRGVPIGLYVCRPREYSLEKLPRQFRRHTMRGLEITQIRPVEPAELLREGLQLNLETMERQGRYDPEFGDPAKWKQFVDAVSHSPVISVMGAYLDGRLCAYLLTCREDGCLHMLYKMSAGAARGQPVGHALDYRAITDAAADPEIELVENSFVSMIPNEGLDAYKRHMGFTVEPHHMEIHFHPRIAPWLTNRFAVAAVRAAWNRRPNDPRLQLGAKVLEAGRMTMTNHFPILDNSARQEIDCQHTGCMAYSRAWRPHVLFLLRITFRYFQKEGVARTARKAIAYLRARGSRDALSAGAGTRRPPDPDSEAAAGRRRRPVADGEALGLQPGDWVEVKSWDEIRATLDEQEKNRGLLFVGREMLVHCGRRYRVHKRVEKIFLEESRQNRKLKNTVTLEGVQCQGIGLDCDRSCYVFWREAWLRKVEGPGSEALDR